MSDSLAERMDIGGLQRHTQSWVWSRNVTTIKRVQSGEKHMCGMALFAMLSSDVVMSSCGR